MNGNPFRKPYTYRPGLRNTVAGKRAWRNQINAQVRDFGGVDDGRHATQRPPLVLADSPMPEHSGSSAIRCDGMTLGAILYTLDNVERSSL